MNPETPLLRQVHPSFVQNGRPTSQVFRPTPKDDHRLSVDDGSRIEPRASWERFTRTPDCRTAGVMAVTAAECAAQALPVVADGVPYPEHCYIDFAGLTKSAVEKKAKLLAAQAIARDWLFQPLNQ